jgi:hypothetical protein
MGLLNFIKTLEHYSIRFLIQRQLKKWQFSILSEFMNIILHISNCFFYSEGRMINWVAALSIVAGLLLLFAGRKFFWLAAGLAAFIFGMNLFQALFKDVGVIGLVLSAIGGVVLGWLAVKFIKLVGYIVGALAGAAALPLLLSLFGISWNWLLMALIGAVIGFLLVRVFFDWGLIIMTAWIGANSVISSLNGMVKLGSFITSIGFLILIIAGILTQRAMLKKSK